MEYEYDGVRINLKYKVDEVRVNLIFEGDRARFSSKYNEINLNLGSTGSAPTWSTNSMGFAST